MSRLMMRPAGPVPTAAMTLRGSETVAPDTRQPTELEPYPWGAWICFFCEQVNDPEAWDCEHAVGDSRGDLADCPGRFQTSHRWAEPVDLNTAPAWYQAQVEDDAVRQERRRQNIADQQELLDDIQEQLARASWLCPRCANWNLSFRRRCYKCSTAFSRAVQVTHGIVNPHRERPDDSEDSISEDGADDVHRTQGKLHTRHAKHKRGGKRHYSAPDRQWDRWSRGPGRGGGGGTGGGRGSGYRWLAAGVALTTAGVPREAAVRLHRPLPSLPFSFAQRGHLSASSSVSNGPGFLDLANLAGRTSRDRGALTRGPRGRSPDAVSYVWSLSRRALNALWHALFGNGGIYLRATALLLAAPVLWETQRGARSVVEDVSVATAAALAGVVEESGEAGRKVARLELLAAWFLASAVRNRLAHMLHGNVAGGVAPRLLRLADGECIVQVHSRSAPHHYRV